jgi:hypothetical protein
MKPLRTPKTAPLPKSAKKDVVSFEENTHESKKENASPLATRPPWNSDVYVHQVVKTKTALTPFPHKIATGSVNPLRGRFDEDVRSRDEEGSMSPSPLKYTFFDFFICDSSLNPDTDQRNLSKKDSKKTPN